MAKKAKQINLEDEFSQAAVSKLSERISRKIIGWTGSWTFLVLNLVFFALWPVFKLPYNLLTFWVSLEAIVLSLLILINANRESIHDRSRAVKDYKIDLTIAKKVKEIEKKINQIKDEMDSQKHI